MQSDQTPLITFRDLKIDFNNQFRYLKIDFNNHKLNHEDIQRLKQKEYNLSKQIINEARQHRLNEIFNYRIGIYLSAHKYINEWMNDKVNFIQSLVHLAMIATLNFIYYAHIVFAFIEVTLNSVIVLLNLKLLWTLNTYEIKNPTSINTIKLDKNITDEKIKEAFNAKTNSAQQFRSDDWYAMGWLYLEIIKETLHSVLINLLYQNFYTAYVYLSVNTSTTLFQKNSSISTFFESSYFGYDSISKNNIIQDHYFSNMFHHEIKTYEFLEEQLKTQNLSK
ncbi:MAG: hypothetical protein CMF42_04130 [Legionellales bacterium]|nr:hypothetical protein [Legionellales bacterium]OUX67532.1 MAG: hypothetical protein CBD38_02510 [bacterium TMED178]